MVAVPCPTKGYLTEAEVVEFRRLAKKLMNKDLTYSEAEDQGTRLIMLFELILHTPLENDKN